MKQVDMIPNPKPIVKWERGDQRVVKRISLLPRCIDGCWHTPLTIMFVVQEYRTGYSLGVEGSGSGPTYHWKNLQWSVVKPEGFSLTFSEDSRDANGTK